MALVTGQPPSVIDKWPAKDVRQMRWLYSVSPFGPVRGDMQAWLIGLQGRLKKPLMLKEAQGIFDYTLRRRKKKRPPKTRVTGDKLKSIVLAMGGTVEDHGQDNR